jgi:DNA-binding SARP family transcriptional activator
LDCEAAANNLHGTLHSLRRLLEPDLCHGCQSAFLVLEAGVVRLRSPGLLWIDVEAFELAASLALSSGEVARYEAALALFTGDLLPERPYSECLATHRDALRSRYLLLLHELASLYEAQRRPNDAVRVLERLVAVEPADEDAVADLMRLYTVLGQRHQALRHYQQLCRALRRELDCDPDPRIVQLRDHISRTRNPSSCSPLPLLTSRERQVTDLLARGLTNHSIALQLGMSIRTAETHVSRVLRKLDVYSRDQVAVRIRTATERAV